MSRHAPIHAPIRLRELRLAADIGGKMLALQAGIPAWIIYQIETGRCNPLLHKARLKKVAKVLDTSLAELLKPATDPVKTMPSKDSPVRAGVPNLPAVIKKRRPPQPHEADAEAPRRGRPPLPATKGEMVEISIAVGGEMIGGITTRDTKAMRAVLRDIFGYDHDE